VSSDNQLHQWGNQATETDVCRREQRSWGENEKLLLAQRYTEN